MSKYFKRKKAKELAGSPEPRQLDDIRKAYSELSAKAANAQYLVFIHTKELEQINGQLMYLNQEAAARQNLDTAAKADAPKTETGNG